MKILFLTRSLNLGGAERQMVELAKGLHRRGHTVIVAAIYSGGPLLEELHSAGVTVHVLEKQGRWDVFGFVGRMIAYIISTDPDILHGYHIVPNLLSVLCKPFIRSTKIVWGVRSSNMDLTRYDWLAGVTFKLSCLFSRFADCIIVNSTKGKTYHQSCGYPAERMLVVFNGVDTHKYKPDQNARSRIRNEWGISPHTKLIGIIGRMDPMKDHLTFLRAANIFNAIRQDVQLVSVGGVAGTYRDSIMKMCGDLGLDAKIRWVGERHDMAAIYNALDLLTSCSITEGFSNVIAEAMSCGVPCVVTDVGDSAMIVGRTGFVVPARSPQSLAEAWQQCLDRYRDMPVISARQQILSKYSLEALIENSEKALQFMQEGRVEC